MKKRIGWAAACAAVIGATAALAQSQAQVEVEATASPVWAAVFVGMVVALGVWFVIAMLRAENKRKAEQKSG